MNGVIGIGQFCEIHGPCLIFCTQAVNAIDVLKTDNTSVSRAPVCDACTSLGLTNALISHDEDTAIKYISTQIPHKHHLQQLLKHACVRSLSCEIAGNSDGGSVCFGDNERGYVISHTFRIADSQARGFHRWHTIVLLMRDKIQLLSIWPFFISCAKELVQYLQEHAIKIYTNENGENVRASRLHTGRAPGTPPRPLAQLCGLPAVWGHIHTHLAWILRTIPRTLQEVSIRRPNFETENTKTWTLFNDKLNSNFKDNCCLREVAKNLTDEMFISICYCLSIQIQVLIRGNEIEGARIVNALNILLPPTVIGISKSEEYLPPEECILLAVKQNVAVPRPSDKCLRIDILPTNWIVKWEGKLPDKPGTFVTSVVRAVKDDKFCSSALKAHINSLVLYWMNISQAILWSGNGSDRQLFRTLGAGQEDLPLINYWCKIINV